MNAPSNPTGQYLRSSASPLAECSLLLLLVLSVVAAGLASAQPTTWRWGNRLPTGEDHYDVADGNSQWVALGTASIRASRGRRNGFSPAWLELPQAFVPAFPVNNSFSSLLDMDH